jgi:hypothetical protein
LDGAQAVVFILEIVYPAFEVSKRGVAPVSVPLRGFSIA